jgi:hypothetical protein
MRLWLALTPLAAALAQPPNFVADRVLPSGGSRPTKLAPGMPVSIYGDRLGPIASCTGNADTTRRETPSPARPRQSHVETLIFPTELCGVQVFLAGRPAGILYVSDTQINFKVPQETPVEGEAELKVVFRGQEHSVKLPVGLDNVAISLDQPAHSGGPVWLRIDPPLGWQDTVRYPVRIQPWEFGCQEIEVRRNGQPLPRIAVRPGDGGISMGLICGTIGIVGHPATHTGRLPIHLQYRFDQPGVYEVRYTSRQEPSHEILFRSDWTRINILPADVKGTPAPPMPNDPADVLSDWLPNQLGDTSAAALDAVIQCLYHPEPTVRHYAAAALLYWSEKDVRPRLTAEYLSRGPSDVVVDSVLQNQPDLLARAVPYLRSNDPVLLRGAVIAVRDPRRQATPPVEDAMLDAAEHIIRIADEQTVTDYVAALGTLKDNRASTLLWDLIRRGVATEQARIAITWRKNPADLPRLAAALEGSGQSDRLNREMASLPYALHNSYGEAALPYLESAVRDSHYVFVRTNCARELILAGRHSGFAFVADAIANNQFYKAEMTEFVRQQFPDLRGADEAAILAFLSKR